MRRVAGDSLQSPRPFLSCSRYLECEFVRPLKANADGHIVKELSGQLYPHCQWTLVLQQARYGMFIDCSSCPACDLTEVIDRPDETVLTCTQCGKGKLLQRKSRFGKVFHACERYPECQFALNHKPVAGTCLTYHNPILFEKKTAQGVKRFCASTACGKPVTAEIDTNE